MISLSNSYKMSKFLLPVFALFITSCGHESTLSKNDNIAVTKAVTVMLNQYHQAIKTNGLLAEFGFLDSTEDFYWVPPGFSQAINFDSVATILKLSAPKFKQIDNAFEMLQVFPLTNELATYNTRIRCTMTDTANQTTSSRLVETGVVIKRTGGWRLLCGQTAKLNP